MAISEPLTTPKGKPPMKSKVIRSSNSMPAARTPNARPAPANTGARNGNKRQAPTVAS
jgi:hypothetical protein